MQTPPLRILYEDNHLLAIDKPASVPTMGAPADRTCLVDLAKQYIKEKYDKPGNVFLGVVSRLDAPVTGIVIFARTSKAANRLCDQFRNRSVEKRYWALIDTHIDPPQGTLQHWLKRHERHRKVLISRPDANESQEALLNYRTLRDIGQHRSLLEIELLTGRKHQIRVQLSAVDCPILGDRKYGSQVKFPEGIALHSRSLQIQHPVQQRSITIEAPVPSYWPRQVNEFAAQQAK